MSLRRMRDQYPRERINKFARCCLLSIIWIIRERDYRSEAKETNRELKEQKSKEERDKNGEKNIARYVGTFP